MERRAEEEAGDASLAAMRPETAVAKGSLLRGLVCTDAAGGLYGASHAAPQPFITLFAYNTNLCTAPNLRC